MPNILTLNHILKKIPAIKCEDISESTIIPTLTSILSEIKKKTYKIFSNGTQKFQPVIIFFKKNSIPCESKASACCSIFLERDIIEE